MNGMLTRLRLATRAARAAPQMSIYKVAAAAGTSERELADSLRGFKARGRCDALAASAFARGASPLRVAVAAPTPAVAPSLARMGAVNVPQGVFQVVAGTPGWSYRQQLVPSAPRAFFATAAANPAVAENAAAAGQRHCPSVLVTALVCHRYKFVRVRAAASAACPAGLLALLAGDDDWRVVAAVAANPAAAAVALATMAVGDVAYLDDAIIDAVCEHPNCGPSVVAAMARSDDYMGRAAAAMHELCDPVLLGVLAADEESVVQAAAASNPHCDTPTLARLSRHDDSEVREVVADNPNCDTTTLETLAADNDLGVRCHVALRGGCGAKLLKVLAADDEWKVRAAVCKNRTASGELLAVLAEDATPMVGARAAAALTRT